MPARRTSRRFRHDRAEVGVGTLIVFIAMVLVAAVAAAVIISTSGTLQERALATGKEATTEVSSNFRVVSAYGERPDASSDVESIKLYMELSAGAPPVPLEDLVIRYSDGTNEDYYQLGGTPAFTLTWIRGQGTNDVLKAGDLLELEFDVDSGALPPRATFELSLIPGTGNPVFLNIVMPATYGSDILVTLR